MLLRSQTERAACSKKSGGMKYCSLPFIKDRCSDRPRGGREALGEICSTGDGDGLGLE